MGYSPTSKSHFSLQQPFPDSELDPPRRVFRQRHAWNREIFLPRRFALEFVCFYYMCLPVILKTVAWKRDFGRFELLDLQNNFPRFALVFFCGGGGVLTPSPLGVQDHATLSFDTCSPPPLCETSKCLVPPRHSSSSSLAVCSVALGPC